MDNSIQSAMHIYEKAHRRQPAAAIKSYCYSLPSRRMAKKKKKASVVEAEWQQPPASTEPAAAAPMPPSVTKSLASLPQSAMREEEELLVAEVRQKLNALLLYKYQHSKATRELAEVRQALSNLQHGNRNVSASQQPPTATNSQANRGPAAISPVPAAVASSSAFHGYNGIRSPGIRQQLGGRNRNSTSSGE